MDQNELITFLNGTKAEEEVPTICVHGGVWSVLPTYIGKHDLVRITMVQAQLGPGKNIFFDLWDFLSSGPSDGGQDNVWRKLKLEAVHRRLP